MSEDWLAGPPPPPPGRDPEIPVVDPPPRARRSFPVPRARLSHLTASPWVLAPAALLLAYLVAWLVALVTVFRHQRGLPAQQRVLDLLAPGSVEWAGLLLLAVAIVAFAPGPSPARRLLLAALAVGAASVGVAAGLGVLVELADFGNGIDAAFAGLLARLAVLPVAAATAWWAAHALSSTPD